MFLRIMLEMEQKQQKASSGGELIGKPHPAHMGQQNCERRCTNKTAQELPTHPAPVSYLGALHAWAAGVGHDVTVAQGSQEV